MAYLDYDSESGVFTWRVNRRGRFARIGSVAGADNGDGQIRISIAGVKYVAHRLAWLYMTGEWPDGLVDHRDMNRSNNRWANLRLANKSQNMANRSAPSNNTSGAKGVSKHSQYDRWVAQAGGRYLGVFKTQDEAVVAYRDAAPEIYGDFARLK